MAETSTMERPSGSKPFGPVAAAFLAAGVGGVVLGALTTLAEASEGIKDALDLNSRVGPLSGKTIFAVAAWLVAWAILHVAMKDKDPAPRTIFIWTGVLYAVAVLLTFPIFFQLFAPAE